MRSNNCWQPVSIGPAPRKFRPAYDGWWLLVIGWLVVTISSVASADTRVWVQNNTKYPLEVDEIVNWKTLLPGDKWQAFPGRIEPGKRVKVMSYARAGEVARGKTYVFDAKVWPVGLPRPRYTPITLRQWIEGTALHSKLTYTVRGVSPIPADQTDTRYHRVNWKPVGNNGRRYLINYRAWDHPSRTDHDVEYVFTEIRPFRRSPRRTELSVLSYNVAMLIRPIAKHDPSFRARLIANRIKGHDVVVFSELQAKPERKTLLDRIKHEYPHQSGVLNPHRGFRSNGGVVIVSRWPFVDSGHTLLYRDCKGSDCKARKGAMLRTINKKGQRYHIVGTHMDADDPPIMLKQARQLKNFIDDLGLPASQPVIYAGDFNADSAEEGPETPYRRLLRRLDAGVSANVHPFICSYDYRNNDYVGNEEALDTRDLSRGACREFDHVLYSRNHLIPARLSREVMLLRAQNEILTKAGRPRYDLSDHYPVRGVVTLR